MTHTEELLIAVVVALLIGYKLGESKRQTSAAALNYDPLGWLNQYTTA